MKLLNWLRPRPHEVTDAKIVSLTPMPNPSELSSTVRHPETFSQVPLNVNEMNPHEHKGALLQLLTAKAEALHASGGLDQDNLNALYHEINSWRDTYDAKLRQDAESGRKVAATLLAQLVQNLEAERGRLRSLNRKHDEALEHHRAVLRESGYTGRVSNPDADDLEQLLGTPTSHLDRHLPQARPRTADNQEDIR